MDTERETYGLDNENVWFFIGYISRHVSNEDWETARAITIREYSE